MDNKLVMISIAAVIGIIVLGSVLMPILDDAKETAGAEIVKTNTGTGHTFKEMVSGDVLRCDSDYNSGSRVNTWTLNGEPVLNEGMPSLTWDWGIVSDVYYLNVNDSSNASVGSGSSITDTPGSATYYSAAVASVPIRAFTWTMGDNGVLTIVRYDGDTASTPTEYECTWAYVVSTVEDGAYMSAQATTNSYFAKLDSKDVILAGNYTTGDFDTGYYYGKDGVLTVLNSSYTGTVNFTQDLTDGTTDIYDTKLTVTITDGTDSEEFSPYRALVPYQVSGHESSGSAYQIYGAIPVLIVAAILLGIAGLVIRSRME